MPITMWLVYLTGITSTLLVANISCHSFGEKHVLSKREVSVMQCTQDRIVVGRGKGFLTFPNQTAPSYEPGTLCVWTLIAGGRRKVRMRLTFLDLNQDVGCNNEFVAIYDKPTGRLVVKLCGTGCKDSRFTTPSNKVKVMFRSNGNITGRGFALGFRRVTKSSPTNVQCRKNCGACLTCGADLQDEAGTVTSPLYPNIYPTYMNCLWRIQAPENHFVRLDFKDFDIPGIPEKCEANYLNIFAEEDGSALQRTLCGTYSGSIIIHSSYVRLTFVSGGDDGGKGFNLTYEAFESDFFFHRTLEGESGVVGSPDLTNHTGVYQFTTKINVREGMGILFTFEEFRLPGVCGKTYVVIGDEKICGIHHGRMLVENSTVDVVYKTEAPDDDSHFLIKYDEFQLEDFTMLTTLVTAKPIFATLGEPTSTSIPPINHRWNSTVPTIAAKPTFATVEEPANTPIVPGTQPWNTTIPTTTAQPAFPTVEKPANTSIPPRTQPWSSTIPTITTEPTFPTVPTTTQPWISTVPTILKHRTKPTPIKKCIEVCSDQHLRSQKTLIIPHHVNCFFFKKRQILQKIGNCGCTWIIPKKANMRIKLQEHELALLDTPQCHLNQLVIYEGDIEYENNQQGYCKKHIFCNHVFPVDKAVGFRFWSYVTKPDEKIGFKFKFAYVPVTGKGIGHRKRRSIGSNVAMINSYPWQVYILKGDVFQCGGSILDEITVITAAHCVDCHDGCEKSKFSIVAGAHNRRRWEDTKQHRKVMRCVCHELYDGKLQYDIAMLALEGFNLVIGAGTPVDRIELATRPVPFGTNCKFSGWGALSHVQYYVPVTWVRRFPLPPRIIQFRLIVKTLPVDPAWNLREFWPMPRRRCPLASLWCGKSNQGGGCPGDSGGPLVCEESPGVWRLHGVVKGAVYTTRRINGMLYRSMCSNGLNVFTDIIFFKNSIAGFYQCRCEMPHRP